MVVVVYIHAIHESNRNSSNVLVPPSHPAKANIARYFNWFPIDCSLAERFSDDSHTGPNRAETSMIGALGLTRYSNNNISKPKQTDPVNVEIIKNKINLRRVKERLIDISSIL